MSSDVDDKPPRILVVMDDQWRRALLRAALRQAGYDAIGVHDIAEALLVPPQVSDRGDVRLVIVDQSAFAGGAGVPTVLRERLPNALTVLLGRVTVEWPEGEWTRVLRRPFSVEEVVTVTESILPLPPALRQALD